MHTTDLSKGFWVGLGFLAALLVWGLASGLIGKVRG